MMADAEPRPDLVDMSAYPGEHYPIEVEGCAFRCGCTTDRTHPWPHA